MQRVSARALLAEACGAAADPRLVGDPVDTLTGALLERKLEFRLVGPLELSWWRHYDSSMAGERFTLGWGHAHAFDCILYLGDDKVVYGHPVGQQVHFPRLRQDGDEARAAGFTLERLSRREYQLHRHAEPSTAFSFTEGVRRARPSRLFNGEAEICLFHDKRLRLDRIVHSTGAILRAEHTEAGLLSEIAFEHGDGRRKPVLSYTYNAGENLIATRDARGHGYALSYDGTHRMTLRRGRKGFRFRYIYDDAGRCTLSAGEENLYGVALTYDGNGRCTVVRCPDGGVWTYRFLPSGKLFEIADPLGGVRKLLYDMLGRVSHEIDPLGNVTAYRFDAAGAPISKVLPSGYVVPLPEVIGAPDPSKPRIAVNSAEYQFGRLSGARRNALPGAAALDRLLVPRSVKALVALRAAPDPVAVVETPFKVRPLGYKWWPAPVRGRVFNVFGKLETQHDDANRTRRWSYDASGNLETFEDFDGGTWRYDFGNWHLLRAVTTPSGAVTKLAYTTSGRVASCRDPGGTLSEYGYDLADRLINVRRHGRVRESYARDAAGNLVAKHADDGTKLLDQEIGAGNLLVRRVLASGDEHEFSYDKAGRCVRATSRDDEVVRRYAPRGRLLEEMRNGSGLTIVPDEGGLETAVYFGRFPVRALRASSRAVMLTDPVGGTHTVRRLAGNLMEVGFAGGAREFCQFDGLGRCVFKSLQQSGGTWTRRYQWSGEGELRCIDDSLSGEVIHTYDAAHRLTERKTKSSIERYVLDAAGNLLSQPGLSGVALAEGNLLAEANGCRFEYDGRDHVARCHGPDGTTDYAYDSCDRLVEIRSRSGAWSAAYDAFGRRTRKTWQGRTTKFHWFGEQLIAETDADGRLRLYLYADSLALTPLLLVDYDAEDAPPESGRVGIVIADQVGAPVLVFAPDGTKLWQAKVAPYGSASLGPGTRVAMPLRFPGHYADAETGLHYNRFRYYSPTLGRYLQSDPWGIYGGTNLYGYRTNPLLKVDVRGLGEEGHCPPDEPPEGEEGTELSAWEAMTQGSGEPEPMEPHGPEGEPGSLFDNHVQAQAGDELPEGVGVGPYAVESIPAGPATRPSPAQQTEINRIGDAYGCHNCGTTSSGRASGNWIGDHQPPTALNPDGGPQRYYPHCDGCSRGQGGTVGNML